jgi:hypothetical protein
VNGVYDTWNAALADRYFSPTQAGKPVYLSVDDDALLELFPDTAGEGATAEAFAAAVRTTLRGGDSIFVHHLVRRTEWRQNGCGGPPPYLGLLGLCVLAASRMARDPEKAIERTAFYPQLNPLLNRPQFSGMPPGFEQVDDLWKDLRRWLDDDLKGARGTATAATHHFFTHIGWPISQCLLREADRRRLTEFFRAAGLEPHTEIEPAQLWTLLRNWAREGCGLSDQALRLVRNARPEIADQMAEIVKREFDVWEGELLDPQGRRRGEIALVLEIAQGGRRILAKLVPRKPDGFPDQARWQLAGGGDLELARAGDAWYQPLELEPSRTILASGVSMSSNGFALAYEPGPVIPLRASLGVGAWASVRQATAIEEHCLVTTEALLPRVREFLLRYAENGWRVLDRTGNLPGGWRVVERVRITHAVPDVADDLRRLAPRLHTATRLEGGLQVAPRQYLTRGEPDLWITIGIGERAAVELDERTMTVSEGVLELKLSALDPPLAEGEHEIVAGGIRRHFSTFSGFPLAAPAGTGSLGHILELHGTYRPSSVDAEQLPVGEPRRGQVFVCGASTRARQEDLPEPVQPPVLVPAGFRAYTVVGAQPGEVLSLLPAGQPHWLRDIGPHVQCQFFDQPVAFEPEWLIVEGRLGTQIRPLRTPPADPDLALLRENGSREEGLIASWCEAISDAARTGARPHGYGEMWDKYVAAAS